MQTFLPYPEYDKSVEILDRQRLGKQRVETLQLLNTLLIPRLDGNAGWSNHPAARMWKGHEYQLYLYGLETCKAWTARGIENTGSPYRDSCAEKMTKLIETYEVACSEVLPWWIGNETFHSCHRATLLFKAPEYYREFTNWQEVPEYRYIWPLSEPNAWHKG